MYINGSASNRGQIGHFLTLKFAFRVCLVLRCKGDRRGANKCEFPSNKAVQSSVNLLSLKVYYIRLLFVVLPSIFWGVMITLYSSNQL